MVNLHITVKLQELIKDIENASPKYTNTMKKLLLEVRKKMPHKLSTSIIQSLPITRGMQNYPGR